MFRRVFGAVAGSVLKQQKSRNSTLSPPSSTNAAFRFRISGRRPSVTDMWTSPNYQKDLVSMGLLEQHQPHGCFKRLLYLNEKFFASQGYKGIIPPPKGVVRLSSDAGQANVVTGLFVCACVLQGHFNEYKGHNTKNLGALHKDTVLYETHGIVKAMAWVHQKHPEEKNIVVYSDSTNSIDFLKKGILKRRNKPLDQQYNTLLAEFQSLVPHFDNFSLQHVPRAFNYPAHYCVYTHLGKIPGSTADPYQMMMNHLDLVEE